MAPPSVCKLCLGEAPRSVGTGHGREFWHCVCCGLVFVGSETWLAPADERRRYDLHHNEADNAGYARYLATMADVVATLAPPSSRVLDFGSGAHAVLAAILRDRGYAATAYDPVYGIGSEARGGVYDVIVLCEVIEHLRDLRAELCALGPCLAPGGHVVVRTQPYPSADQVRTFWYSRDPTHINFFAPRTFATVASLLNLSRVQERGKYIFVLS